METMEIKLDAVPRLMNDIWGLTLGMEIAPAPLSPEEMTGTYTAWVRIIGSQNITLILKCPESLAHKAAAAMFDCKPEAADPEQVKDSLKEIVNILAGNVKGMMTKYHFLSMPSVCEPDREPRFPAGDLMGEFGFQSSGETFKLTLLKVD